jgi:aminopeptidase N
VKNLAMNDSSALVRADAIELLGKLKNNEYKPLFIKAIYDSSYTVAGKALKASGAIDPVSATEQAKILSQQTGKGEIKYAILSYSDENNFDSLSAILQNLQFGNEQYYLMEPYIAFLNNVKNTDKLKRGIDIIVKIRGAVPPQYHYFTDPYINDALKDLLAKKQAEGLTEQADYITTKLPEDKKQ